MFQILTHDILPVFAILALGYGLGWRGTFSRAEAAVVNRVSLTLLQPALIFPLVATVPIAEFDVRALALYGLCEAVGFGIAFLIARRMFRREAAEAWMLAMAVVFVNSLLYSAESYEAAGKLTKPAWCTILGLGVVLQFVSIGLFIVQIALFIAALVYLTDVRPALGSLRRR